MRRRVTRTLLAGALADCLDRIRTGASVEECLSNYPQLRPQLDELLETARKLAQSVEQRDQRLGHYQQELQRHLPRRAKLTNTERE